MGKQEAGNVRHRKCILRSVVSFIAVATVFAIGACRVYGLLFKRTKCCEKIDALVDDIRNAV